MASPGNVSALVVDQDYQMSLSGRRTSLHGPKRWYRHDYSKDELVEWANRIKASSAKRAWIYFNNDNDAYAPKNAAALRHILSY